MTTEPLPKYHIIYDYLFFERYPERTVYIRRASPDELQEFKDRLPPPPEGMSWYVIVRRARSLMVDLRQFVQMATAFYTGDLTEAECETIIEELTVFQPAHIVRWWGKGDDRPDAETRVTAKKSGGFGDVQGKRRKGRKP